MQVPSCFPIDNKEEAFIDLLSIVNELDARLYDWIDEYRLNNKLGDSSYSEVLKAVMLSSQFGTLLNGSRSTIEFVEALKNKALQTT